MISTNLGHSVIPARPPLQVFLSIGLGCPAILMMLHKKHSPMEVVAHSVLFYAMLSGSVCAAAEAAYRNNPLLTAGRVAGMFLQVGGAAYDVHTMFPHRIHTIC